MNYTEGKIVELIDLSKKSRSETNNLEFKDSSGGFSRGVWKTISSFSHRPDGGVIIYGVREDSNGTLDFIGVSEVAKLQEQINSFFVEKMVNSNTPDIKVMSYEDVVLIAVVVSPITDEQKPCYFKDLGVPGGACIRVGNSDNVIDFDQLKEFIRHSSPFKFDKSQAKNTSLNSLSEEKVRNFFNDSAMRARRSFVETDYQKILMNLKLADVFNDEILPTVAGYLIFSEKIPQDNNDFSRYTIRCIKYAGETVSSPIIDKLDVSGTLDNQIEEAHSFVMRNIPIKAELQGSKRIEKFSYPEEAIREVVANSVVHRDYQITETYTQICVFSNRIEISNAGNLPPGINIENIKDAQFSRNEVIASTLKDMGYIEEYGRGINLVYSKMREWDLLNPLFKNKANCFKVTLLGEEFKELNPSQIVIWQTIQDMGSITAAKSVEILEGRSRQSVNSDIRGLVEKGLISKEGSGNNIHYRPTY